MTTSSSTVWELTRDQIISAAMRKLGVLGKGQSPDSEDLANGQIALNGIIGRFSTLGMPLWKRTVTTVPLDYNVTEYTLTGALKLTEVYLRNLTSSVQYRLERKSLYDFKQLPYSATGVPVSYAFTSNLAEGGVLEIWPTPTTTEVANYTLITVTQDEFDTFTGASETPDFPSYWSDALIYALAVSLAPEFGTPLPDRQTLSKEAMIYLAQAQSYGDEDGSITFAPERRY